jgi:hypothetical protein
MTTAHMGTEVKSSAQGVQSFYTLKMQFMSKCDLTILADECLLLIFHKKIKNVKSIILICVHRVPYYKK